MHVLRRPVITVFTLSDTFAVDIQRKWRTVSDLNADIHIVRHNENPGKIRGTRPTEAEEIRKPEAVLRNACKRLLDDRACILSVNSNILSAFIN